MPSKKMFSVVIKKRAVKKLEELPREVQQRILEVLEALEKNPLPADRYDLKKLRGYRDTYRIRIGDYRIVYTVIWYERKVVVHFIGPRGRAY